MFSIEKFAMLLSSRRREKGLSQGQLADLVGVTHQAVSKWERAEAMPEISKIGDIARAIDVPADELISTLYDTKPIEEEAKEYSSADEAYFHLPDKTHVGELYSLAPKLSKETLHIAIDTLIASKGAGAASMLYPFADREYLCELGTRLFAMGDMRLAEYVDDSMIKSAVVDAIASADTTMDNNTRVAYYQKAGQLLTFCRDAKFVNDMFAHFTDFQHRWDIWRTYISKFPSEAVVTQGIKMAIHNGPGCFNSWWEIIGRRNIAKIFLGYIDNYEKNNYRAWSDVAKFYGFADCAIMEKSIRERINDPETDLRIFVPLIPHLSADLREILAQKGVVSETPSIPPIPQSTRRKSTKGLSSDAIEGIILSKFQHAINSANIADIPKVLENITASLGSVRAVMNNQNADTYDETVNSILMQLDELNERFDEIENRLDEIEDRLDEQCERLDGYGERIELIENINNEDN